MQLSLYVVPMICKSLASQPIATCIKENQHLTSLELADYSEGDQRFILVSSDNYWDLVTVELAIATVVLQLSTLSWDGYCLVQCAPKKQIVALST